MPHTEEKCSRVVTCRGGSSLTCLRSHQAQLDRVLVQRLQAFGRALAGSGSVSSTTRKRHALFLLAVVAVLTVPTLAEAQRRRVVVRRPAVRSVIYVGPYAYPRHFYDTWYQWGYPYPPYGYRYSGFTEFNSSLRIQVTPRDAEVFVDGYRAGRVDDFDGVFQRLRLRPGGHEITVFLEGYETVRDAIYLEAGAERKLQFAMNRLSAGARSEPPPAPSAIVGEGAQGPRGDQEDQSGARSAPQMRIPAPPDRQNPGERVPLPAGFGTLSIRVQPADAEILIDGERWATSGGQDRMAIELAAGRHRLEVRRDGMNTYTEDILIRRGATFNLNISLK